MVSIELNTEQINLLQGILEETRKNLDMEESLDFGSDIVDILDILKGAVA